MSYVNDYEFWKNSEALTKEERVELSNLDDKEIEDRFFQMLSFGTAGLRGILGLGTNRMNRFVVGVATQAMANLVLAKGGAKRGVAIGYDCRIKSDEFAKQAASILAASGIKVYLYDELRPTPEISFAIIHFGCIAGINITASHNPKEYNGYKVYWEDGAQLPPAEADIVASEMQNIDIFTGVKETDFDAAVASGLITIMGKEVDEIFLAKALEMQVRPGIVNEVSDEFKLVFTPFHGAGYRLVPEVLKRIGYKHVLCVDEQMTIDGTFPTVKSPNPEDKEGFTLGIEIAKKENVDLIIGTDPDADRVGVVLRNDDGEYVTLSGNQVGVLLADYIISSKVETNTMPENPCILSTIVSSKMLDAVCKYHNIELFRTFTGFKFMAEKIKNTPDSNYLLAFEESYGYLVGDFARDKDAVTASMLIAEMAAYYKTKGITLSQAVEDCYKKYGYFAEKTISITMPGIDGLENMKKLMHALHTKPLEVIAGVKTRKLLDYLAGTVYYFETGKAYEMELSGSDVVCFQLEDGTSFIVRPSGTEPKVKVYILAKGESMEEVSALIAKYETAAKEKIK